MCNTTPSRPGAEVFFRPPSPRWQMRAWHIRAADKGHSLMLFGGAAGKIQMQSSDDVIVGRWIGDSSSLSAKPEVECATYA